MSTEGTMTPGPQLTYPRSKGQRGSTPIRAFLHIAAALRTREGFGQECDTDAERLGVPEQGVDRRIAVLSVFEPADGRAGLLRDPGDVGQAQASRDPFTLQLPDQCPQLLRMPMNIRDPRRAGSTPTRLAGHRRFGRCPVLG